MCDWYFLCTLGELKGSGLSRNIAAQDAFGSWDPAGRGGPPTRRGASSMLLSLCIAFWKKPHSVRDLSAATHSQHTWIADQFGTPGLVSATAIQHPAQLVTHGFWIALAWTWEAAWLLEMECCLLVGKGLSHSLTPSSCFKRASTALALCSARKCPVLKSEPVWLLGNRKQK